MQETQIPSLIQEEPTCHGAIKPCATTRESPSVSEDPTQPNKQISKIKKKKESVCLAQFPLGTL